MNLCKTNCHIRQSCAKFLDIIFGQVCQIFNKMFEDPDLFKNQNNKGVLTTFITNVYLLLSKS